MATARLGAKASSECHHLFRPLQKSCQDDTGGGGDWFSRMASMRELADDSAVASVYDRRVFRACGDAPFEES
jgi:hypothetical protein